jgi:predicted regulator of amino acid metabolism with ACT domain
MINDKDVNSAVDKITLRLNECLEDLIKNFDALTIKYSRISPTIMLIRMASSLCENIVTMTESYKHYEKVPKAKALKSLAISAITILDEIADTLTKMYVGFECVKDKIDTKEEKETKETKDIN